MLPRLTSLAGENLSTLKGLCFGVRGFLIISVDLALYLLLISSRAVPGTAQILSFSAAAVFFYSLILRGELEKRLRRELIPSTWREFFSFLTVALMSMFLRGGLLATFIFQLGWPSQLAILPALAVSAVINYFGCAFFVFPLGEPSTRRDLRRELMVLGVIGYLFLLRLFYLGATDLLPQEAYYWIYAQHLDIGYLDHPPMVAWVIWLGITLFRDTEPGVRLGAFAGWIITAFFCFRLGRDLLDSRTALRALLLLSFLPFFFSTGMTMTPDSMLVPCWAGSLYFLERSLLGGRRAAWWGVGICAGLGMLSKYTIALLCPAVILFFLIDRNARRWFLRWEPYGALALALLLFTPVVIWNSEHQWASFVFQGPRRFTDTYSFTFPELVGSVLLLLTPTGALGALIALGSAGGGKPGSMDMPLDQPKRLFLFLLTLFPLLFFVAFSLVRTAKLNWTGPLWLASLPLMAWQMLPQESWRAGRLVKFLQRAWPPTIILFTLLFGLILHFWALGLPGVPYPKEADLSLLLGWKDLARKIDRIDSEIQASHGVKPLVVGMDKCYIASELIFYRNKLESGKKKKELLSCTTGRHLFGMDSLMYRYWFPQSRIRQFRQQDSILILVTRELSELNKNLISLSGWRMDKPEELHLETNGVAVGTYYYALAGPK